MDNKRLLELATKWLKGTISEEEKKQFSEWYNSHDDERFFTAAEEETALKERIFGLIIENTGHIELQKRVAPKIKLRWQMGIAASLLGFLSVIMYHSYNNRENIALHDRKVPTLTLANGKTIELKTDEKGIVAGNVIKYLNGSPVQSSGKYPGNDITETASVENFKLSTPKGLIYLITLPDGSRVTLNAGSTLIYPSVFAAEERIVELVGEAFFDVAKVTRNAGGKARVPFKVKTSGQSIQVLGTKFNVSAYRDERITQTTLIEGAVSVKSDGARQDDKNTFVLAPGQQAMYDRNNITVRSVDVEPFIAWVAGYFQFENANIPTVMSQLQRWYDFELSYESSIPDKLFMGKIPRNITLREAITVLKKAGINIRLVSDKKVVISASEKSITKL